MATLEQFLDTTDMLIGEAEKHGIKLRLLGSIAFRLHCPENVGHLDAMNRELTDIDFAASGKDRRRIREFFVERGWQEDKDILVAMEGARYSFYQPDNGLDVDVFFDRLDFCHPIELAHRLHLDSPTICLGDLVLEKLQIVEINEKDIKDLIVCFLEHDVGPDDREQIDDEYIAKRLSGDWGFWYTATSNLAKLESFLPKYESLPDSQRQLVTNRIAALLERIEKEPKSLKWKTRARVGTKMRWYNEVSTKAKTF